jgi:YVTN family beta-propeller protein
LEIDVMSRVLTLAIVAALMAGAAAAQTPTYKVVKTVPLGAPEKWDYVVFDAPTHRVYVAHGDRVTVVDGQAGKVLGEVTGIAGGTHGVAIANGKGYTDDGTAGVAVVFDPKTFKVIGKVAAKEDADGIAIDPVSGHVFVVDGDSKVLTVIDPKTDKPVATIEAGGGLEYAVAGAGGVLYVNGAEKKELLRIDTKTNAITARWSVPGCTSPHGLAVDTANHRLFTSCVNKVMTIVNTDTGAIVATLPIGAGTDAAAYDPVRKRVLSSNGDGTLTVIAQKDPNTYAVIDNLKTQVTGKTMGIDPHSGRLYIAAADIDPKAPVPAGANGKPGRPKPLPGSLKLIILDPIG